MAKLKNPRYVKLRPQPDGTYRPRAAHGPRERALGFADMDLKNEDGSWFTPAQAYGWSIEHQKSIVAARLKGNRPRAMPITRKGESVRDLLEDFQQSRRFKLTRAEGGYSDDSKKDYKSKIAAMMWKPQTRAEIKAKAPRELEPFMLARAKAITGAEITNDEQDGFFDYLCRVRGRTMARTCIMVLSAAYKWGKRAKQWRLEVNPCTKLGLGGSNVSLLAWQPFQIEAFVAFGDHPEVNEPGLVEAVLMGIWSGGQREKDVIHFTGAHPCEVEIEMPDGAMETADAIRFVQSKRGARVEVLALPPLVALLERIKKRREENGYTRAELIIDNHTGKGFNQKTFQHRLQALRKRVEEGDAELGLPPCKLPEKFKLDVADGKAAEISWLPFKALRRTFLSWLDSSGTSDNEWAAVSGHSLKSLPQVKPHYSAPNADQARAGMQKVWVWLKKKGIAS
jgi:hypothetical protein